jgi:hypothetical protein
MFSAGENLELEQRLLSAGNLLPYAESSIDFFVGAASTVYRKSAKTKFFDPGERLPLTLSLPAKG